MTVKYTRISQVYTHQSSTHVSLGQIYTTRQNILLLALKEGNWYISNRIDEQLNIEDEQNVRKDVWQKEEPRRLQRGVHLLLDGGAEGRCLRSSLKFHAGSAELVVAGQQQFQGLAFTLALPTQ